MEASLATLLEHPTAIFAHQVRTSTLVIELCQSVLGIDIADIVEDGLDMAQCSEATRLALTQPLRDSPPETARMITDASGRSSTLEYVVDNVPVDFAIRLIREGRMPLDGAPLAFALSVDHVPVVEALLAAGADVNAHNWKGWTVLHEFSNAVRF